VGNVNNVDGLANIMGCMVSYLPMKYLGLPLEAPFKARSIWDGVIEKNECRLAKWKRMYLYKGGRITLIKSTRSNLTKYFLSLFPIPVGVANRIEKLQRNFLWSRLGDDFKFHLVNWSKVCSPIVEEGLGSETCFDSIVKGKLLWCYVHEIESLCKVVIDAKCGSSWGEWCSNEVHGSYGVGL
jgi:hypothetical protein